MKKFGLFALLLVFMASCDGPMGPQGPAGEGMQWDVAEFEIRPQDWHLEGELDDLGSYYYYTFEYKKLTKDVFQIGTVDGYRYTDGKKQVQVALPFVSSKYYFDDNGVEQFYNETHDFEYEPGYITFYLTYSDFYTSKDREPKESFFYRIVLNW